MAADEEKSNDFYAVLGLKKECSAAELRNAYKNLAMKWHPDRCSASGNSKLVEEAKKKFQAIQAAYSVLSDANKRFLYDVGVYDCDDDEDENGMGDFLNEMAAMMSQNKSSENEESFEDLQELFEEMFQSDIVAFASSSRSATPSTWSSSSLASCGEAHSASNKRNSWEISSNSTKAEPSPLEDSARGRKIRNVREGQEVPVQEPVRGGTDGSGKYHLVMMSPPMTIPAYHFHDRWGSNHCREQCKLF